MIDVLSRLPLLGLMPNPTNHMHPILVRQTAMVLNISGELEDEAVYGFDRQAASFDGVVRVVILIL